MNPRLEKYYEKTIERMKQDPRVLGAYMSGSVGTAKEDDYSDVDPVFVTCPRDFCSVDGDLRAIFAEAGILPVLWWPERGNNDVCRNYAVFFYDADVLLQYDVTIESLAEGSRREVLPDRILFDNAGVFQACSHWPHGTYVPGKLRWFIEFYWIYGYIMAKYLRRGDAFKLIAGRQELFTAHLHVAHALEPDIPNNWWPIVANDLKDASLRANLLLYWGSSELEALKAALPDMFQRFSEDAHHACARWSVDYPAQFESAVRAYSEKMLI